MKRAALTTVLVLTATVIGCRTDDGATSTPAEAGPALLPPVWEKPQITVAWGEPPLELVVELYEVRHADLDRRRVSPEATSVLDGAPEVEKPDFTWGTKVPIRTLAKNDPFRAELDAWCRASPAPAVLVETIRAPLRKGAAFEWDIPKDATPAIVELSVWAERLENGRARVHISRVPVSRPPVDQSNYIPGLNRGSKSELIEIGIDEWIAIGGLTIRQPKKPTKELRGLRLVTVAEETIELLAIVSAVPPEASRELERSP
jgi:hypothetical protein